MATKSPKRVSRAYMTTEPGRLSIVLVTGLIIITILVLSGCSGSFEPFIGNGTTPEGVRYYIDGPSSVVEIRGTSDHPRFRQAHPILRFYCNSGDLSGHVGANILVHNNSGYLLNLTHLGSIYFNGTYSNSQDYGFFVRRDIVVTRDPQFYETAKYTHVLEMALNGGSPNVKFDLIYVFNTPMQENLDRCGEY